MFHTSVLRAVTMGMCSAALFALSACDAPQERSDTPPAPTHTDGAAQSGTAETAGAGTGEVAVIEEPAATESERLNTFFQRVYDEDLDRSPMTQSYRGLKDNYGRWDDLSEEFADETMALIRARLDEVRGFDYEALNDQAQLSYDIFVLLNERAIANDRYRHHGYVMNQFRAWHTIVPSFLINIHRVTEPSDLTAYVERLEGVELLFDQVIEQMRIREDKGIFPPRWSYPMMIEAARNVMAGAPFVEGAEPSTLLNDFTTKLDGLDLSDEDADAMRARAVAALTDGVGPAYARLIAALERQMDIAPSDDGAWKLPDGEAYYQARLAHFTTTDLTAEEVHQIGLDNVERIHGEMRAIMEQVGFEGTLNAFFDFMRTDDQFYYPTTDEGRTRYLAEATALIDIMGERLPEVFGILPRAELIVKRVEPFRERSAGKAFYQRPAADGSRPGIYYANLYDMAQMPTYQMEALAYHEGVPGHHMQLSIAQELEGLPQFRKFASITAYTEGWGLYSEFLPKEMGFYEDPYSDFGRLAMELWRACRLVVDTGIHHKRWTREEAVEYLVQNTPNPRADAQKAIERYIVYTGQATAYLIGKEKILDVREAARAALGEAFDIRAFHDEVLRDGPLPLLILEDKIEAWTNAQLPVSNDE